MNLEEYYNKFNEDKRLDSLRGQVEYLTSMKYIRECLKSFENPKIIDIGAGTGKYCCALANDGYDVTAVELCKSNLGVLKSKKTNVKAYQGNALDLSRFEDSSFDVTILFGPMYHLHGFDNKIRALNEAKRVTKNNGYILVAYINNDYAVIEHGFREGKILDSLDKMDESFRIKEDGNELYSYVRVSDIDYINSMVNLKRCKLIAVDGLSSYIREDLKKLSKDEFDIYMQYHLSVAERSDMLGTTFHYLDILMKE
ncbi:MAG: class I SAM-dependent methyltransferase [Erysipelotrichaceae bacterium]